MKGAAFAAALLLPAVLIGWLVKTNRASSALGGAAITKFEITECSARRVGAHVHLTVEAALDRDGTEPLRLEPPLVSLSGPDGTAAPRYLGPLLQDPVVSGSGRQQILLHYWLPAEAVARPLVMEVEGRKYGVTVRPGA